MKKLLTYLSQEVPGVSVSIFRVFFGFILASQSLYWIIIGFIQKNILDPTFLFPFIKGLKPLNDSLMNFGLNGFLLISSILIMTNKLYRIGLIIYLSSFTYLWLLCQGYFNNHYYLISIICFLLLFSKTPFSLYEKIRIPKVHLYSLKALIVIVYFIAGINKLNTYWLIDIQPMTYILSKAGLNESSNLIPVFSYLGLFFDLLIGPLLIIKKTRFFAIVSSVLFHLMNFVIFLLIGGEIGFFPFIMISTLILFIDPNRIEKKFLKRNARLLNRQHFNKNVAYILSLFLFFQIIIPFRHLFFEGYVDYNGIGQRFSWRLKNMYKEHNPEIINFNLLVKNIPIIMSNFNLSDNPMIVADFEGEKINVYLTERQKTNLFYYPNIIPVLAKNIEFLIQKKIKKDFIINGECHIGFMGREKQLLFDPNIDLTEVSNSTYKTNTWLKKLKEKP